MSGFLYSVELPFSKKTVSFKEISTKDQLFLAKSMLVSPEGLDGDLYFINTFAELLQRSTINVSIQDLSVIEVLLLGLKIRSISMGPICKLQAIREDKQTIIELDCDLFLKNVFLGLNELNESHWGLTYIANENTSINIKLGWLTWKQLPQLLTILTSSSNPQEISNSILPLFIREIIVNHAKNIITWSADSGIPFDVNKIPAPIQHRLVKQLLSNIDLLKNIDLFQLKNFNQWHLDLLDSSILQVFKLPFLFNLSEIHQEIFMLSGQLDAEYILNLSSQERRMYLNFFPKKNTNSQSAEVQQLAQEFNQSI